MTEPSEERPRGGPVPSRSFLFPVGSVFLVFLVIEVVFVTVEIVFLILFVLVFIIVRCEVEFERIRIADDERLATLGAADFVSEIHIGGINFYFRVALWAGGHTILEGERRSAGNSGTDVPEFAGRAHDKSESIA